MGKEVYACQGGKRLHKSEAFTLEGAKAERTKRMHKAIAELEEELRTLKAALKEGADHRAGHEEGGVMGTARGRLLSQGNRSGGGPPRPSLRTWRNRG